LDPRYKEQFGDIPGTYKATQMPEGSYVSPVSAVAGGTATLQSGTRVSYSGDVAPYGSTAVVPFTKSPQYVSAAPGKAPEGYTKVEGVIYTPPSQAQPTASAARLNFIPPSAGPTMTAVNENYKRTDIGTRTDIIAPLPTSRLPTSRPADVFGANTNLVNQPIIQSSGVFQPSSIASGILLKAGYRYGGLFENEAGTIPGMLTEIGANLVGDIYAGTKFGMEVFGGGAAAQKAVETTKGFRVLPTLGGYKEIILAPLTYAKEHPEQGIAALEMAAFPLVGGGAFLKAAGIGSGLIYGLDVLTGRQKEAPADVAAAIFSTPATMQIGGLIGKSLSVNPIDTSPLGSFRSVSASAATGGVGGVLFSGTQDVQKGLPFHTSKAAAYGLVGTAFGAGMGMISVGQVRGEFPKLGLGRIEYKQTYPTEEEHAYAGVYYERQGQATPLFGLNDLKPSIGTPTLKTSGLMEYPTPMSPFETKIIVPSAEKYFRRIATPIEGEQGVLTAKIREFAGERGEMLAYLTGKPTDAAIRFKTGLEGMDYLYKQEYPNAIRMSLKEAIGSSELLASKEGAPQAIIDIIKSEKASVAVYGSMSQKTFMGPEMWRSPVDIDIYTSKDAPALAEKFVKALSPIFGKGNIRVSIESPSLVEIKSKGSFIHAFDIHPIGGSGSGELNPV
jgi:hypothetical protein